LIRHLGRLACALFVAPAIAWSVAAGPARGLELFDRSPNPLADPGAPEFLEPDRAFIPALERIDERNARARWDIAEGYYLYREKFRFEVPGDPAAEVAPGFPPGAPKDDPYFGPMEIYTGSVSIPLALDRGASVATELSVTYQGCAEAGLCYPPMTKVLPLIRASSAAAAQSPAGADDASGDAIAAAFTERGLALTLAQFFGFGLLLAFTPCVLPMIPILSGIIVGQGERLGTRRALALSGAYVMAMAVMYAFAGVLAGVFGHNLQATLQHPAALTAFSAVFVALAASMFGLFDLQLPAWWQTRLGAASAAQPRGTLWGAAAMGALSAVIVGPCVAPPLAGALLYIAISGDALTGGAALFTMALGMGLPLLIVGTSAGRWLPRGGPWLASVKHAFGVVLLGVALWLLGRVLPAPLTLLLWGALLSAVAVFLGALEFGRGAASGWRRLGQALGFVLLVYGAALVVGAAGGGADVLRPLAGFTAGRDRLEGPSFLRVKGPEGFAERLHQSRGRPVMLDFYADWCVECKHMERRTFADPRVREQLARLTLLQADVTANDGTDRALLRQFGLYGPPAILFFGPDGREQRALRLIGFVGPEAFSRHLDRLTEATL
jgi:thiol:disulfide interchange protein DsbD